MTGLNSNPTRRPSYSMGIDFFFEKLDADIWRPGCDSWLPLNEDINGTNTTKRTEATGKKNPPSAKSDHLSKFLPILLPFFITI